MKCAKGMCVQRRVKLGGLPYFLFLSYAAKKRGGGVDQDFLKFQTRRGNVEHGFLIDFLGFNGEAKNILRSPSGRHSKEEKNITVACFMSSFCQNPVLHNVAFPHGGEH